MGRMRTTTRTPPSLQLFVAVLLQLPEWWILLLLLLLWAIGKDEQVDASEEPLLDKNGGRGGDRMLL